MEKNVGHFGSIFKGVLAGNLASSAIQKAVGMLGELPKMLGEFAERGDQIERTSKILGISADSFQRLSYAAKITGTPIDIMRGGLEKLNKAIGLGERGMGPLIHQVMRLDGPLGAQLRTVKSSDQAFMMVADAVARTSDKMKQAAIVTAVFGRSGQEMLPMLLEGSAGLEKLKASAKDVISDKALSSADVFRKNMIDLKENVQALKDRVLSFAITLAEKYLPPIMKWLDANREIIATKIENFIDRFATALENARPVLQFLLKAAGWLISNWPVLGAVYLGWIAAQIALDAALDANPIGLITLAIQAMIVEVLIVIRYWHEITSALEASWNWFNKLFGNPWIKIAMAALAEPFLLVASVIQTIIDLIQGKGLSSFKDLIKAAGPIGIALDLLGVGGGANAGHIAGPARAPNEGGMSNWNFINQVNVDNSRAPGVSSQVYVAPPITGHPGYQSEG